MPDDLPPYPASVPAPEALADAVARVERDGERITLTRDGKPVAVLVPVDEAAFLGAWEDAQDAAVVREARAEYARSGHTWPTLEDIAREHGIDLSEPET
jgi:prevent-host-death family protein